MQILAEDAKYEAMMALENGKVLYLPSYPFLLNRSEKETLFSETLLDGSHKNISYDCVAQRVGGVKFNTNTSATVEIVKIFMQRFVAFTKELLASLLPSYQSYLKWGRTSYRPAEICNRKLSKRKDDTRLHVDAFPSTPVHGNRILRIFCNINPYMLPRVWLLGEPFGEVLARFASRIPPYNEFIAKLLKCIKATKTLRSPYDHYQLHLHDSMKLDENYQRSAAKQQIHFPAQSTWLVFTDQVSHAALSGQYLLEQTVYLPVEAMKDPHLSPLRQWEKIAGSLLDKTTCVKF